MLCYVLYCCYWLQVHRILASASTMADAILRQVIRCKTVFLFIFLFFYVYFMMQATQNRIIIFFLGEYCLTLPCDCVKDFFPLINLCIMIRSRLIMLCKLLNLQCKTGRICMWFSGGFAGLLLRCIKCGKAELIHHSPSFIHDIPSAVVYCLAGRALAKRWVDYMLIKSFMRSWIWLRNRLKA